MFDSLSATALLLVALCGCTPSFPAATVSQPSASAPMVPWPERAAKEPHPPVSQKIQRAIKAIQDQVDGLHDDLVRRQQSIDSTGP